ncbi:MAG: C-terminal binding protein [Thermomicrobiales bacterium]|nr:C-terminal binding protein [Thermomicrobiales bacterium]
MSDSSFRLVYTSDRYDLGYEVEALSQLTDIQVELVTGLVDTPAELVALARNADALVVSSREAVPREAIEQLDKCQIISRMSVGIDHVDLDAATDRGIVVTHCPDYCTDEVADHALALILALNRRIVETNEDLHQGAWVERSYHTREILRGPIPPLREQTLGIVGFGRIGQSVARRATPFGVRIVVSDPYIDPSIAAGAGVELVSLEELARQADIITLHCPLTDETRGMIDSAFFDLVKPTAVLVNTARGGIVDMDDIAAALTEGRLAGAGLDVVVPEPLPTNSPLYSLPNVILTPHNAYYSERSIVQVRKDALDGALSVLRGMFPRTVANPGVTEKVDLRPWTPS